MNNEGVNTILADKLASISEIEEKLLRIEEIQRHNQDEIALHARQIAKLEKKIGNTSSIKIYQNIIQKELKNIRQDMKELKHNLKKTRKQGKENKSEIRALAKFLRFALRNKGYLVGKKTSLKKMFACLPYSSHVLLGDDTKGGIDAL